MENFDRQYRLAAGKAGSTGFEIGSGKRPLHISFSVEKADTNSQNTAKVTIWNLSDEHLAELRKNDCVVVLHAGYGCMPMLYHAGSQCFDYDPVLWRRHNKAASKNAVREDKDNG